MLTSTFASMSLHGSCQASFASGQRLQQRQPLRLSSPLQLSIEAAHKKGGGSTKNGRDSKSKRRGVKVYGGQSIKAGGIIVRQLGTKVRLGVAESCPDIDAHTAVLASCLWCMQFHPGVGVGLGNDYTLYALKEGVVTFKQTKYLQSVGGGMTLSCLLSAVSRQQLLWSMLVAGSCRRP